MSVARLNGRAASALIAGLVEGGVGRAVLSPGARNTPLLLAATARGGLRCHVVHDERAAGFLALGLARASRQPVALVCTSGSAGAHYLPAFMEASAEGAPLIALTADRPPELHGCGANQTAPQGRLLGDFADAREVGAPFMGCEAAWRHAGRRAGAEALAGPVHLNVAFREPLWGPEAATDYAPPPRVGALWRPDEGALSGAAAGALLEALAGAERGVIHCGSGAARGPEEAAAVRALGRALGWPVLAEASSGVRYAGGDPGAVISHADATLRGGAVRAPDRVLRLGRPPLSRAVAAWLAGAPTVLAHPAGRRWDPAHGADHLVCVGPRALAEALLPRLPEDGRGEWWGRLSALDQATAAVVDAARAEGWWAAPVAHATVRSASTLHLGNSMAARDADSFAPADGVARRVYASRGLSGIDGTLATAAGEALIHGGATVLLGDLSFLHDLTGLLAAATLSAPLTAVVLNNGGGGIFEHLPVAQHPTALGPCFVTPHGARLVLLCGGLNVVHTLVKTPAELERALASQAPGPRVIEAVVDRAEDTARHRAVWAAADRAQHTPNPQPEPRT